MEDPSFVKLLITEDVYLLSKDAAHFQQSAEEAVPEATVTPEAVATPELQQEDQSAATEPQPKVVEKVQEPVTAGQAPAAPAVADSPPSYAPPVFEGNYLKKVLVVVHSAGLDFAHKELLMKILGAVKLTKEDVAILPSGHITSKADFDWMALEPKKSLIAFGLPDKWKTQIVADHSLYQIRSHMDYQLVFSEKLEVIAGNVESKKKLWAALQNL